MPDPGLAQVFLTRHGRTEWNRVGRRQGRMDSPITPEGMADICAVATMVAPLGVDAIFSSPIGRAATTAAVFAERCGLPVVCLDELQEIDHGAMSGLTNEEIEDAFPGQLARREAIRYQWRFPAGESYADVDLRAASALASVARSGALRPLIVSHEMIGRMLLRNLLDLDPAEALRLKHPHDVIYQVDVESRQVVELRPDRSLIPPRA